eukprot:403358571
MKRVQVLNHDIIQLEDLIVKVKTKAESVVVVLDSQFQPLQTQNERIVYWNTEDEVIEENDVVQYTYFQACQVAPLSLQSFILLEFNSESGCRVFTRNMDLPIHFCKPQQVSQTYKSTEDTLSKDHFLLENNYYKLELNEFGLPKEIALKYFDGNNQFQRQQVKISLETDYWIYDGRITHSTESSFSPIGKAIKIGQMKLHRIDMEDGPLMKCLRYFVKVKVHHDLMFEQRYCLHKVGEKQRIIHQKLKVHNSQYGEVAIRFKVDSESSLNFHAFHESQSFKQEFIAEWEAQNLKLTNNVNYLGYNSFHLASDTFELILQRNIYNTHQNGKLQANMFEREMSDIQIDINLQSVYDQQSRDQFIHEIRQASLDVRIPSQAFTEEFQVQYMNENSFSDLILPVNQQLLEKIDDLQILKFSIFGSNSNQLSLFVQNANPIQLDNQYG